VKVAVITVSDSVSRGKGADRSGPAVAERCSALGWEVASSHVVPDDRIAIEKLLMVQAESRFRFDQSDRHHRRHRHRPS
jgi:molybdopterin biosynthesis enzyme MoaB